MSHMNEQYADRLLKAPTALIDENDSAATNRMVLGLSRYPKCITRVYTP